MYTYRGLVNRVVDGDTVHADIDLGFEVWLHDVPLRILGINCREKAQAGGPEAREYATTLMPPGAELVIKSIKTDKYGGRWNASITLADGRDVALTLMQNGWAAAWNGAGTKPVPPWPRTEPTPSGASSSPPKSPGSAP